MVVSFPSGAKEDAPSQFPGSGAALACGAQRALLAHGARSTTNSSSPSGCKGRRQDSGVCTGQPAPGAILGPCLVDSVDWLQLASRNSSMTTNRDSAMSRPLRIPNPETALQLYRHLLREASYLPPLARPFVDGQIKHGFARHRKDGDQRRQKHMRQAHHDLRMLRAANAGDLARMRRVMLEAFGRTGPRRRDLMSDFLHRGAPANLAEHEKYAAEISPVMSGDRKLDWLDTRDLEKLRTLARSQVQAGLVGSPKPDITAQQTNPDKTIPVENSWGRPLPRKVYRTKLKNGWKAVADKCMPPLPKAEWETLAAIAQGTVQGQWLPPPRRVLARLISDDAQGGAGWDWQSYAVKPVVAVDRPARRRSKLLTGAVDNNTPGGDPEPVGCHKYTARTWRRLLQDVWTLSSTMEEKVDEKAAGRRWNIAWGKTVFHPAPAAAGAMEFFNDLPEVENPEVRGKRRT